MGLSGRCTNRDAFQKGVLLAHNVQGVVDAYATGLVPYVDPAVPPRTAAAAEPDETGYVIEKGDTLWKIAAKFLGSGNRYPEIFAANREITEHLHAT